MNRPTKKRTQKMLTNSKSKFSIKNPIHRFYILIGLLIVIFFRVGMTTNSIDDKLNDMSVQLNEISSRVNKLSNTTYTKSEMNIVMDIYGNELSKNILYDWNSIVRTVIRPDDKFVEYDKKIKKLKRKLTELQK